MEEKALYGLPSDGDPEVITAQQKAGGAKLDESILTHLYCPTRRSSNPSEYTLSAQFATVNRDPVKVAARTDYASNAGTYRYYGDKGPSSLTDTAYWSVAANADTLKNSTGVIFLRSKIKPAKILDGLSKTYLLGEKNLDPNQYFTGTAADDNHACYQGATSMLIVGPVFMLDWIVFPYKMQPGSMGDSNLAAPIPAFGSLSSVTALSIRWDSISNQPFMLP